VRETSTLTSILSLAAPTPGDLEQAVVTVRRGLIAGSVRLSDVFDQPSENIGLQPGDIVIVRNMAETVNVLGAPGVQGRVRITKRNYSLMDAVSDSRGLNDAAADPAAVFVMLRSGKNGETGAAPRVYRFNFRDPAQLAVASAFTLRDGDAIFISNASFTQTEKVLSAFSGVLNTARSVAVVAP